MTLKEKKKREKETKNRPGDPTWGVMCDWWGGGWRGKVIARLVTRELREDKGHCVLKAFENNTTKLCRGENFQTDGGEDRGFAGETAYSSVHRTQEKGIHAGGLRHFCKQKISTGGEKQVSGT